MADFLLYKASTFPIELSFMSSLKFSIFNPFNSYPNPASGRGSKQVHGTWWLAGVKPQASINSDLITWRTHDLAAVILSLSNA